LTRGRVFRELVRCGLVSATNAAEILKRVPAIVPPGQIVRFEAHRERRSDPGRVAWVRVIDEWRISSQHHQMVWRRRSRNIGEIIVAQRKLSSIRKIRWNISLNELLADRSRLSGQPCAVSMIRVPWRRIRRPRHHHPVSAGESAEVIVQGMIFLENDHNVVNFARAKPARLFLPRGHVKRWDNSGNPFYAYLRTMEFNLPFCSLISLVRWGL